MEVPRGRVDSHLGGSCKRQERALVRGWERWGIFKLLFWASEMHAEWNCGWEPDGEFCAVVLACRFEIGHRATSRHSTRCKCG